MLTFERQISDYSASRVPFNQQAYSADNQAFPFQKEFTFNSRMPFERIPKATRKPNVIVIFAEGFSARLIGRYGGKRTDLTPTIDSLARRSMQVDNYFNHTAPTHRGLQGFLISAYPSAGVAEPGMNWEDGDNASHLALIRHKTLTKALQNEGYETLFLSPHSDVIRMNSMLRALDFDQVYSLEYLQREVLDHPATLVAGSASDGDLFPSLNRLLERRWVSGQRKPFFMGVYNIGTHAFFDVAANGIKYGDGSNPVLNRMHNFDAELAKFLSYFFASPYAKNTVLIFTSDHATYPEPPMVEAMKGEDYQPYFIDRIPLLISAPGIHLPEHYDADGRTSVDLAPTLLNLLGIQDRSNSFLGRSIFEDHRVLPFGVAAIIGQFYATDRNGVYNEQEIPQPYQQAFIQYKELIQKYFQLEKANRIYQAPP